MTVSFYQEILEFHLVGPLIKQRSVCLKCITDSSAKALTKQEGPAWDVQKVIYFFFESPPSIQFSTEEDFSVLPSKKQTMLMERDLARRLQFKK